MFRFGPWFPKLKGKTFRGTPPTSPPPQRGQGRRQGHTHKKSIISNGDPPLVTRHEKELKKRKFMEKTASLYLLPFQNGVRSKILMAEHWHLRYLLMDMDKN